MRQYRYDAKKVLAAGERLCLERGEFPSGRNIARRLGVSRRQVVRWRTGDGLSVQGAIVDRLEAESGIHISHFERDGAVA